MSSLAVMPQCVTRAPKSKRRKYSFTPAMDEAIRGAYRLFLDYGNRKAIGVCATRMERNGKAATPTGSHTRRSTRSSFPTPTKWTCAKLRSGGFSI